MVLTLYLCVVSGYVVISNITHRTSDKELNALLKPLGCIEFTGKFPSVKTLVLLRKGDVYSIYIKNPTAKHMTAIAQFSCQKQAEFALRILAKNYHQIVY